MGRPGALPWFLVGAIVAGAAAAGDESTARPGRAAASAAAPPDAAAPLSDGALRLTVDQLDDPSFERREQATAVLVGPAVQLERLYPVLGRGDLGAEPRHRLLLVVKRKLLERPRGAIGIRMQFFPGEQAGSGYVLVSEVLPGLPAEGVLRPGDMVTAVDGQPLHDRNDLPVRVQRKPPGGNVTLDVRRPRAGEDGVPLLDEAGRPVCDELAVELVLVPVERLRPFDDLGVPARTALDRELADAAADLEREFAPQPRLIQIVD